MSHGRDHNVVPIGEARAYKERREFSLSDVDPGSFSDRWMLFTHAAREWVHALDPDETALLFVIMDALYGWQVDADRLPLRRLYAGKPGAGRGTGRERRATQRTIHKLIARGLIRTSGDVELEGCEISINTLWMPEENQAMGLAIPKAVREDHARRQLAKPGALEITARKAYEETHAEVKGAMFVPWSKKQLGILNKVVIAKWSAGPEALHDFIDWCFREWSSLRRQGLHWMDDCPDLPDIGTLIAGHKALIRAWNSRASREWVHNLDLGQKRRLEQLKRGEGLTNEAAVAQMMREDAKAEIMGDVDRKLAEAARRERAGQIAFQQANRMKPFSAENRHPLSKAAQAEREAAATQTPSVQPGSNPVDDFLSFKPGPFRED